MKAKILYFKGINFNNILIHLQCMLMRLQRYEPKQNFIKRNLYEVMTTGEEDIDAGVVPSAIMVTHRKFSLETLVLST